MNRQLSSKVYNRVKNLYCLFSRCFFVMTKFGIFVSCLAYSETLFGIFCLRGLGNTVASLPKHVLRLHQVFVATPVALNALDQRSYSMRVVSHGHAVDLSSDVLC